MATNWTDDQLSAITTTGKGIIVSAAAGSGKTAVLIERTIRLLCDEENKIPADKLLAVTFTNDAASQMREKLNNALNAKIEQNPENEWFMLQQMKLQMAKISTINSFCLELVKNNIHQFDISSGVRILDETEYFVMQEKAIEIVLEKNYSEKPDMMKFLNNCFCVGNDKKLIDILKELYKFSRSLPFKESWFDNALESFDENSKIFGEWERIVLENIYSKLLAAKNIYVETNRLASALSYHSATKEIIHNDYIYFETAEKVINSGEWDSIFSELKKIKFSRFSSKADKNAPDSQIENEVIEKIKKQRNQYKELLNELSEALWYSRRNNFV